MSTPTDSTSTASGSTAKLFLAWRNGDKGALDPLMERLGNELRRLARRQLSAERPEHTLQSVELVNEAYLRLVQQRDVRDRAHFFALASRMMRRILANHARDRSALKRGGDISIVPLPELDIVPRNEPLDAIDIIALHRAMEELTELDPRQAQLVDMRVFGGLTNDECAEVLGISVATVKRDWTTAKAWLRSAIEGDPHSKGRRG